MAEFRHSNQNNRSISNDPDQYYLDAYAAIVLCAMVTFSLSAWGMILTAIFGSSEWFWNSMKVFVISTIVIGWWARKIMQEID